MTDAAVDWISLSTVMSSVPNGEGRCHIARECVRVLKPGGFLFYFDRVGAHSTAETALAPPSDLFPDLLPVSDHVMRLRGSRSGLPWPLDGNLSRIFRVGGIWSATHRATLLAKSLPSEN